mmetsp:Transcript_107169/g.345801  ORF Transcript_107169/g.345801 Transcript_107169/m.345801 type:complete len:324 (-) Transcript_107169:958-1929(-)
MGEWVLPQPQRPRGPDARGLPRGLRGRRALPRRPREPLPAAEAGAGPGIHGGRQPLGQCQAGRWAWPHRQRRPRRAGPAHEHPPAPRGEPDALLAAALPPVGALLPRAALPHGLRPSGHAHHAGPAAPAGGARAAEAHDSHDGLRAEHAHGRLRLPGGLQDGTCHGHGLWGPVAELGRGLHGAGLAACRWPGALGLGPAVRRGRGGCVCDAQDHHQQRGRSQLHRRGVGDGGARRGGGQNQGRGAAAVIRRQLPRDDDDLPPPGPAQRPAGEGQQRGLGLHGARATLAEGRAGPVEGHADGGRRRLQLPRQLLRQPLAPLRGG